MAYNNAIPQFVPSAMPYSFMQQQQQNGLILVLGENAAKSYPVGPGQIATMFDRDKPIYYIKSVDFNNIPTFSKFKYYEIFDDDDTQKGESVPYVTKEEFDAFKNDILGKMNNNTYKPKYNKKED